MKAIDAVQAQMCPFGRRGLKSLCTTLFPSCPQSPVESFSIAQKRNDLQHKMAPAFIPLCLPHCRDTGARLIPTSSAHTSRLTIAQHSTGDRASQSLEDTCCLAIREGNL